MQLKCRIQDITYRVVDNKVEVVLFAKTENNRNVILIDKHFLPYFYVHIKSSDINKEEIVNRIRSIKLTTRYIYYVVNIEPVKKKLNNTEIDIFRVYCNIPQAVRKIKEWIKTEFENEVSSGAIELYEYDIPFRRRYLIDNRIIPFYLYVVEGDIIARPYRAEYTLELKSRPKIIEDSLLSDPVVLAFDIETFSQNKKIDVNENPILSIALYANNFERVITWKRFPTTNPAIEFVNSEVELLDRFKRYLLSLNPDFIVGYYSDGFDLPYIMKRASKYKINLDIGADFSRPNLSQTTVRIFGIQHIDIMRFIRDVMRNVLSSSMFDLNSVAKEILGEEKYQFDFNKFFASITKDHEFIEDEEKIKLIDYLCKYNLQDAYLVFKLFTKLYSLIMEFVKFVSLTPYETTRLSLSQLVEYYLINKAVEQNIIIPNRPSEEEREKRSSSTYKGAFVYEPMPGLYENVVVFDFRSLYPSIIITHNISPDTLRCKCCYGDGHQPPDMKDVWYCKKRKGFVPKILEELIHRRVRIKSILKGIDVNQMNQQSKEEKLNYNILKSREQSLKLLSNSFYGYMAYPLSRWYSIENAKAVTSYGRYYLKSVIDQAKEKGFSVIYGDTDSIFLWLKNKKVEEAKKFLDFINYKLPETMELEFEDAFVSALFVPLKQTRASQAGAKKRYALLTKDGNIIIKGFETVRRDWSNLAKKTQIKVIEILLKERDIAKAIDYVKSRIDDLEHYKVSLEDLAIVTQLQKSIDEYAQVGPHVIAAKRMQEKGYIIGPGMIVKYVISNKGEKISDKVRLIDEVDVNDIDVAYYINNQIIPSVNTIFSALGYNIGQILKKKMMKDKGQRGLGEFLK